MDELQISKRVESNTLIITVSGVLNTDTTPLLEKEIKESIDNIDKMVFDFAGLLYLTSSGLRVLLASHKRFLNSGGIQIKNVNDDIMSIFNATGMATIFDIV